MMKHNNLLYQPHHLSGLFQGIGSYLGTTKAFPTGYFLLTPIYYLVLRSKLPTQTQELAGKKSISVVTNTQTDMATLPVHAGAPTLELWALE